MDILLELRAATAERHAAIESLVPVMRDDVTLDDYKAYLQSFLGFLQPCEEQLAHVAGLASALPDFPLRRKSVLIHNDLRTLGQSAIRRMCRDIPDLKCVSSAMGCLYVLEGSTLGGHVLLRRLRPKLGLDFERASSFLTSYGPNLSSMWRTFDERLTATVTTEADRRIAIAAATETFAKFHSWLQSSLQQSLAA